MEATKTGADGPLSPQQPENSEDPQGEGSHQHYTWVKPGGEKRNPQEEEEDQLAEDDDVSMLDATQQSLAAPSVNDESVGAEGSTTGPPRPESVSPNVSRKGRSKAAKPEKSMMNTFKLDEGVKRPRARKRARREEPNDPNIQVFYHDDLHPGGGSLPAHSAAGTPPKTENALENAPLSPAPNPPQSLSRASPALTPLGRTAENKPSTLAASITVTSEHGERFFTIPVPEPLNLGGAPPKHWQTAYREIRTISGATFSANVWMSKGDQAEPAKRPLNFTVAPPQPIVSLAKSAAVTEKPSGNAGTPTAAPAPIKRGRRTKAEMLAAAAAAAAASGGSGATTPGEKKARGPRKKRQAKVDLTVPTTAAASAAPSAAASVAGEDVDMQSVA